MKADPRSEWMNSGIPQSENTTSRALMAELAEVSGHGITNGKREYSSMIIRKYLFHEEEGKGPLKSILILSIGQVDLIRWLLFRL